jgi:hypothetical protein
VNLHIISIRIAVLWLRFLKKTGHSDPIDSEQVADDTIRMANVKFLSSAVFFQIFACMELKKYSIFAPFLK